MPAVSVVMVKAAAPLDKVALPSDVVPSSRVTVPAGAEPDAAATVTLKVTGCPTMIWVADAASVVVVLAADETAGWITNNTAE